jgi:hypothetical protein
MYVPRNHQLLTLTGREVRIEKKIAHTDACLYSPFFFCFHPLLVLAQGVGVWISAQKRVKLPSEHKIYAKGEEKNACKSVWGVCARDVVQGKK